MRPTSPAASGTSSAQATGNAFAARSAGESFTRHEARHPTSLEKLRSGQRVLTCPFELHRGIGGGQVVDGRGEVVGGDRVASADDDGDGGEVFDGGQW
jgi:hypothetical protein